MVQLPVDRGDVRGFLCRIYQAYGASGGVCGVVFGYLLLFPGAGIGLCFVVPIPGWLYAIGFMVGSFVAMTGAGRSPGCLNRVFRFDRHCQSAVAPIT